MGRRPNQVLQEFFRRGEKQNNNTNRYAQTCNLCSTQFPKGRHEQLVNHLLKECRGINEAKRAQVRIALLSNASQSKARDKTKATTHGHNNGQLYQGPQLPLLSAFASATEGTQTLAGPQAGPQHDMSADSYALQMLAAASTVHDPTHGVAALLAAESRDAQDLFLHDDPGLYAPEPTSMNAGDTAPSRADLETTALSSSMQPNTGLRDTSASAASAPQDKDANLNFDSGLESMLRDAFEQIQDAHSHNLAQLPDPARDDSAVAALLSAATTSGGLVSAADESGAGIIAIVDNACAAIPTNSVLTTQTQPTTFDEPMADTATDTLEPTTVIPTSIQPIPKQVLSEYHFKHSGSDLDATTPSGSPCAMSLLAERDSAPAISPVLADALISSDAPPIVSKAAAASTPALDETSVCLAGEQPWGGLTTSTTTLSTVQTTPKRPIVQKKPPAKGGTFLGSQTELEGKFRRAKFDPARRAAVKEMRTLHACIRCRFLRKPCSPGDTCDACLNIINPRVWSIGCVRTSLPDMITMFDASVQMVLSQQGVNRLLGSGRMSIEPSGKIVEASLVSVTSEVMSFAVIQEIKMEAGTELETGTQQRLLMAGPYEDLANKMDTLVKRILPNVISMEASHFVRTTLETGLEILKEENCATLQLALELWTFLHIAHAHLSWSMTVKFAESGYVSHALDQDTHRETMATLKLQLAAAADSRAKLTANLLLGRIWRELTNKKLTVTHSLWFASLVLCICMEKTTWALKTWEDEQRQHEWPLAKQPSDFTSEGAPAAEYLRVLLHMRKLVPETRRGENGVLVVEGDRPADPVVKRYLEAVHLKVDDLARKFTFSPSEPQSLELAFSSILLLPPQR